MDTASESNEKKHKQKKSFNIKSNFDRSIPEAEKQIFFEYYLKSSLPQDTQCKHDKFIQRRPEQRRCRDESETISLVCIRCGYTKTQ